MNVELIIEPFDLKLGFRELDDFKKLNEGYQQFS